MCYCHLKIQWLISSSTYQSNNYLLISWHIHLHAYFIQYHLLIRILSKPDWADCFTNNTQHVYFSSRFILHIWGKTVSVLFDLSICQNMYSPRSVYMPWTSPITALWVMEWQKRWTSTPRMQQCKDGNTQSCLAPLKWTRFVLMLCFHVSNGEFSNVLFTQDCNEKYRRPPLLMHHEMNCLSVRQPIDFVSVLINVLFPGKRV